MTDAPYDYLIIGGGIAGVTAAETIRTRDQVGRIAIISSERHLLYSRVLLPSYLKGKIPRERVFLRTPDAFAAKQIDIHLGEEVISVDPARREVVTAGGRTFGFEKLLIASGGKVRYWQYDEISASRMYRLQTIDDADRMMRDMPHIREPLVIGASFIALEFIEIFLQQKIMSRLLVREDRFFAQFVDEEGGRIIEENFRRHGVICQYGEEIQRISILDDGIEITSAHSGAIRGDSVAIGIGVERNVSFLKDSGIALGRQGVKTNEYLETNVPGVYAAGDVAEYYHLPSSAYQTIGNWTNAVLQGSRAGLNMAGDRAAFTHIPSYSITNLGMQIGVIGECSPGLSTVVRADADRLQYKRFFLRDGAIVGAFLINQPQEKPRLMDAISHRVDLETYESNFSIV